MRILHLLNTSTFSGAENVAITIINNMNLDYYGAYTSFDGLIRSKLDEENIQFLPIKRMVPSEIRRVINEFKPDIIHAHDFTTSVVCAWTKRKIPVISHLHNNVPWLKKYHIYSLIYLLSSIKFTKILGVSDSIFNEYVFNDMIKKKTKVISNPINIKEIRRKSDLGLKKQYDIIFLGRLTKQKNPQKFIELINKLKVEIPNVSVAMIGAGELEAECRMKIDEMKLNDNIDLLGYMNNPYGILSRCKVLCMTSEWEGFGLVAVEALSLGVPVVATPVGGLQGIINNNCGLLTLVDSEYIDEVKRIIVDVKYRTLKSGAAFQRAYKLGNIEEYMSNLKYIYQDARNK